MGFTVNEKQASNDDTNNSIMYYIWKCTCNVCVYGLLHWVQPFTCETSLILEEGEDSTSPNSYFREIDQEVLSPTGYHASYRKSIIVLLHFRCFGKKIIKFTQKSIPIMD